MGTEKLIELKRQSKVLLQLNENYHKHIYLNSFEDIKKEKQKLMISFGYQFKFYTQLLDVKEL